MRSLGQTLMISVEGESLTKEEKKLIKEEDISGVILFKKNISSFSQVFSLSQEIKSLNKDHPPLVAIDMEGGEVSRLSHLKESCNWPSPSLLRKKSLDQIKAGSRRLGDTLKLLGIDINFAPCLDLLKENSPLLEKRVFGETKQEIIEKAGSFIEGQVEAKIIPCLKHFPGHGGVSLDSHLTLPQDERDLEELKDQLEIFKKLFTKYPSSLIMTAHILFPKIDTLPATLSQKTLSHLKEALGFQGLVVSDDIDMKALKDFSPLEIFSQSLKAGCDLVLCCQNKETHESILKNLKMELEKDKELAFRFKEASQKIQGLRKKTSQPSSFEKIKDQLLELQES